jgi:hypothetical protein
MPGVKGAGFWSKHSDDTVHLEIESSRYSGAPAIAMPDGAPTWIFEPRSSRVVSMAYYKEAQQLYVTWQDGGVPYIYNNVTPHNAAQMRRVKSVGRYINSFDQQHVYGPVG